MTLLRLLSAVTVTTVALAGPVPGGSEQADRSKTLRERIVKSLAGDEENSEEAARAYKELFTHLGRAGLKGLTGGGDTSIALQASWELHRKAVKRAPPIDYRADWVFDRKLAEGFVAFYSKRVKADPPAWWRTTLVHGDVFPGSHHAFLVRAKGLPAEAKVEVHKGEVVITAGKQAVRLPRAVYDEALPGSNRNTPPVALWGKEQSFFARPRFRGYPFKVAGVDTRTGKKLWVASVWAARRRGSTGPAGVNPVEIRREGDAVIVYGCESHGMYAEGFDAKTGRCRFRFCTCYWFNFPEAWGIK
jgi:hypothetical protein